MLKDKALVRSVIVRAVTADVAKSLVGDSRISKANPGDNFTVIRAYRFYKKLTAEPLRKTYIAIDKLLSAKEAILVMTEIENRKFPIVIRPEDLPYTDPNHVCTDKCIDFVEINPSNEYSADSIEVLKGMDKPETCRCGYWIGECSGCHARKELVCETNWCDECLASGAGIPAATAAVAAAFRDEGEASIAAAEALASIPDPPSASVTIEREGEPIQTSSGAAEGWTEAAQNAPKIEADIPQINLEEAAPAVHPSPCSDEYIKLPRLVLEEGRGLPSELTLTVHPPKKSSTWLLLVPVLGLLGVAAYILTHPAARIGFLVGWIERFLR